MSRVFPSDIQQIYTRISSRKHFLPIWFPIWTYAFAISVSKYFNDPTAVQVIGFTRTGIKPFTTILQYFTTLTTFTITRDIFLHLAILFLGLHCPVHHFNHSLYWYIWIYTYLRSETYDFIVESLLEAKYHRKKNLICLKTNQRTDRLFRVIPETPVIAGNDILILWEIGSFYHLLPLQQPRELDQRLTKSSSGSWSCIHARFVTPVHDPTQSGASARSLTRGPDTNQSGTQARFTASTSDTIEQEPLDEVLQAGLPIVNRANRDDLWHTRPRLFYSHTLVTKWLPWLVGSIRSLIHNTFLGSSSSRAAACNSIN